MSTYNQTIRQKFRSGFNALLETATKEYDQIHKEHGDLSEWADLLKKKITDLSYEAFLSDQNAPVIPVSAVKILNINTGSSFDVKIKIDDPSGVIDEYFYGV